MTSEDFKVWQNGVKAYHAGIGVENNPYLNHPENRHKAILWNKGWYDAKINGKIVVD